MNFNTIPEMFLHNCEKYGTGKTVYMEKVDGEYKSYHFEYLRDKVERLAIGLMDLGLKSGDRVGIISENRLEWPILDFALAGMGIIDVPIFTTLTARQTEYIFNDCSADAIVVSNKFQLEKVLSIKDNIPSLRHIIAMNENVRSDDLAVKSFHDIIDKGAKLKSKESARSIFATKAAKVRQDDILTIIYTSGTTGDPKGVILTNGNIAENIKDSIDAVEFSDRDTLLSFLPWCHAYERTTGYYCGFASGATVAFAESVETVGINILEVKPTIVTTVPRLLEMIKKKVFHKMQSESPVKKAIFNWAVEVGRKYVDKKFKGKTALINSIQYSIADSLVFSKIREKTGGRLEKFVSGGAALPPEVCEFFLAAGLTVLEGYGLTEASPVVSVSRPESLEIGTIGKPLRSLEIKIAEDGELLVRGPSVMKGYWNDPRSTRKAIDPDGWLYTGDIVEITEKGNIRVTDRKKNILVSSGGKNIAPQPIENALTQSRFIEQCIILGDSRDFVTALITPDFEELASLAETLGITYESQSELIAHKKIVDTIKKDIDYLQKDHAKYERVRKFSLLSEPFTVENGYLTPKLSIKRHVVERKYSYLINQMYRLK
jgi:long-chain acyl-CoA synthetase